MQTWAAQLLPANFNTRLLRVLAFVTVTLLLASCTSAKEVQVETTPAPIQAPTCPSTPEELGLFYYDSPGGSMPAGFQSVEVIQCEVQADPAKGSKPNFAKFSVKENRGKISIALLDSLKLPDIKDDSATCSLEKGLPTYLLAVNAQDDAVHIRVPEDACGNPRVQILDEIRKLNLVTTRTYQVEVENPGR